MAVIGDGKLGLLIAQLLAVQVGSSSGSLTVMLHTKVVVVGWGGWGAAHVRGRVC